MEVWVSLTMTGQIVKSEYELTVVPLDPCAEVLIICDLIRGGVCRLHVWACVIMIKLFAACSVSLAPV